VICICYQIVLSLPETQQTFNDWMINNEKKYDSEEEYNKRYAVWLNNLNQINEWNSKKTYGHAEFGLTQFSDWTSDEFASYSRCHKNKKSGMLEKECWEFNQVKKLGDAPDSIDWRTKGAVTPVKDQGNCGSCWSFAATGTLEGANFMQWGELNSLSEQNLIDCSGKCCYNDGCDGGRSDWAIWYVVLNKGLNTEESYKYTAHDGVCKFNKSNIGGNATHCVTLPKGDENALKEAVGKVGPVAVAISVNNAFANYKTGVYTDSHCPNAENQLSHAVLVVGYGTENGQDYWIVKNSWGLKWGDQGYIKMRRNFKNMCGIATDAVYPFY